MKLKGKINKIFIDNGNGFKIFSLLVKDISSIPDNKINPQYPTSVSIVGKFIGIEEGYVIEVEGDWSYRENKGYHPWQFSAKNFTVFEMESPEIIMKYLQTLPGIGTVIAENIVTKYGKDSFDIIENSYIKLCEIRGITAEKAEAIHIAFMNKQMYKKLLEILGPYDVSETKIHSIQKKYEEKSIENIKNNPYILSNDGLLSFKIADAIANNFEFEATDDLRIEAAINTVLEVVAAGQGHTYLEIDNLVNSVLRMLQGKNCVIQGEISDVFVRRKVIDLVNDKILYDDDGRVYKTYRYKNECVSAEKIAHRLKLKSPFYGIDKTQIESCLEKAEKELKITLAEKQREAVLTAISNLTTIITGGPGTGKTTTLKAMLLTMDYLAKENDMTERDKVLTAPTGMAAKRMKEATELQAQTIHRLLDYVPYADGEIKCKDENNPVAGDIAVIDESSMLDIDLFCMTIKAIKDTTLLVFLGDIDQLPSVGPGNVLHDLIDSECLPVVRLNQTYRQGAQSPILINANKINAGDTDLVLDNPDFKFIEIPDASDTEAGDKMSEMLQRVFYEEFILTGGDINKIQVLCPMRKQSDSVKTNVVVNTINPELQETVNPCLSKTNQMSYGQTKFRKNDKIMQLTNNYEKEVFNGDVGVVIEVSPSQNKLLVNYLGEIVEYTKDELDQIQHSYATTIHKSQGSEYQVVIIPVTMQYKMMLQRNLIYTGLTRAKKRAYFIGDREALNYAINNTSNRQRNSYLKQRIRKLVKGE